MKEDSMSGLYGDECECDELRDKLRVIGNNCGICADEAIKELAEAHAGSEAVSAELPGCAAEQLEEARIKGRTEAMEFIGGLAKVYRKNNMNEAADMLEREIDNFANC